MPILSSNNLILKYFKGTDPEEKKGQTWTVKYLDKNLENYFKF